MSFDDKVEKGDGRVREMMIEAGCNRKKMQFLGPLLGFFATKPSSNRVGIYFLTDCCCLYSHFPVISKKILMKIGMFLFWKTPSSLIPLCIKAQKTKKKNHLGISTFELVHFNDD